MLRRVLKVHEIRLTNILLSFLGWACIIRTPKISSMSAARALLVCFYLSLLTDFTSSLPALPLKSTLLSLTQDSLALERSQVSSLSLPTSDTFPIPETDLTLKFYQFGPLVDFADLYFFVLKASSDIKYQISQSSINAVSSKSFYTYQSGDGFILEVNLECVSTEKFVSLDRLGTVINGLSQYMMQERQSRTVQFQVIQDLGATTAVVMDLAIKQNMTLLNSKAKRAVSPLQLVQNYSTRTNTRSGNASTLSQLTADDPDEFPIPHTPFSLRFGFWGSSVDIRDAENLLTAVRDEIQRELIAHGRNTRLPSNEYVKNASGLQMWMQRMPWDTVNLAWAELAVVVEGLWLYIVDERHDREAFIDVINHLEGRQVAFGWIGLPHMPLEHPTLSRGPLVSPS